MRRLHADVLVSLLVSLFDLGVSQSGDPESGPAATAYGDSQPASSAAGASTYSAPTSGAVPQTASAYGASSSLASATGAAMPAASAYGSTYSTGLMAASTYGATHRDDDESKHHPYGERALSHTGKTYTKLTEWCHRNKDQKSCHGARPWGHDVRGVPPGCSCKWHLDDEPAIHMERHGCFYLHQHIGGHHNCPPDPEGWLYVGMPDPYGGFETSNRRLEKEEAAAALLASSKSYYSSSYSPSPPAPPTYASYSSTGATASPSSDL